MLPTSQPNDNACVASPLSQPYGIQTVINSDIKASATEATKLPQSIRNVTNQKGHQQSVNPNIDDNSSLSLTFYSLKCSIASFVASYVVGVFHPLELVKTRLQSMINYLKQLCEDGVLEQINVFLYKVDDSQTYQLGILHSPPPFSQTGAIYHSFVHLTYQCIQYNLRLGHDGKSAQDNLVPEYRGVFRATRDIYRAQGFKGLYKGFYISVFNQALTTSVLFLIYQRQKIANERNGHTKTMAHMLASLEAGLLSTLATQPIWVVRTRMILNVKSGISEFQNFMTQSRRIYEQDGARGYLRGLNLSIIIAFGTALQLSLYEIFSNLFDYFSFSHSSVFEKSFTCGSISKAVTSLMAYPLTTLRTRIQQDQYVNNRQQPKYSRISQIVKVMIKDEGIRGFYKGLTANILRAMPQKGFYFYFYELFKAGFINKTHY